MCGVIGFQSNEATDKQFRAIRSLLLESQIRGKHATGVCYLTAIGLKLKSEPFPASEFISAYMPSIERDLRLEGSIKLIGHTRYKTSGETNQPILINGQAISMNGVITQEPIESWPFKTETDNDAEILLRNWNLNSLQEGASFAACILSIEEGLIAFRNGKRPLYCATINNGMAFFSTKEIGKRALGVSGEKLEAGRLYSPSNSGFLNQHSFTTKELQR